jgi:tRNA pseudouridine55 synthase
LVENRNVNGLLLVDKPGAMTSHDVVATLRRATGESSMGHLGTLDPMATGVLPILAGKFTRLAQFFGPLVKSYTGTIRFGFSTDTYDAEGEPTSAPQSVPLTLQEVEEAAALFRGEIEQTPPSFSAKKIAGQPAYKAARRGNPVELRPVKLTVDEFVIYRLLDTEAEFMVRISAGGYVRSLAHDLGQVLGCGAHLATLRRIAAGPFTIDQAIPLDVLCRLSRGGNVEEMLPHPRTLLPDLPATTADLWTAGRLRNGMQVNLPEYSSAPLVKIFEGQRDLVAIGKRIAGTLFQPIAVLS